VCSSDHGGSVIHRPRGVACSGVIEASGYPSRVDEAPEQRPAPAAFGRFAGLAATMYLAAAASLLVRVFADRDVDDLAGWVVVLVLLQVAWCACLGRPCARLSPGRARALGVFTGALLSTIGLAGAAAISDLPEEGGELLGLVFAIGFVGTAVYDATCLARRAVRCSPAGASAMFLGTITPTAIVFGLVSAAQSAAANDDGFLAGLVPALAAITCLLVAAFTLGPWLWTPFVRAPQPRAELPRAEVA